MFTGITTHIGFIKKINKNTITEYIIETKMPLTNVKIGSSIMCSGICLTVIKKYKQAFSVNISEETLNITCAKDWQKGVKLNLERSLKIGDELGGHIVTGHVDGISRVLKRIKLDNSLLFSFSIPSNLKKFICKKGSVSLDGISLTVNEVKTKFFNINVIPHTKNLTTLGNLKKNDTVNIEVDILSRYIDKNINS